MVFGIDIGYISVMEVGVRIVVSGEGVKLVGDIVRVEIVGCYLI